MSRKDLTGQRFGRLMVIRATDQRYRCGKGSQIIYECLCDCGNTFFARTGQLTRKDSRQKRSCGCLAAEFFGYKHGGSKMALYSNWNHMKNRCCNPNADNYANYGGRGITVCDEWKNSFAAFRDWALSNGYQEGLSIERIDVNGNYCPENCRWETMKAQQRNRTNTRLIEYNGETHSVAEWAEITGISSKTLFSRIALGWTPDKILTEPVRKKKK